MIKSVGMRFHMLLFMLVIFAMSCEQPNEIDLIIRNGRVIDPESGYDGIADVGIYGDRIVRIGKIDQKAPVELEASGMVVAPGFIDILARERPNKHGHTHKITDGVTTVFGMHGGPVDVEGYARAFQESGALVNYGCAVGHETLREEVGLVDKDQAASPEQITRMQALAETAIRAGAVGIGFGINYSPGTSYEEVYGLFEIAAAMGVSCHLHARYKGNIFPQTMSLAVMEVIAIASATGARAQLAHLTSSTVGSADLCIKLIEGARRNGVDIGFDFHVWTRNMTYIESSLYDPGWEERFGGTSYSDIYLASTQEPLTEETFFELHNSPGYTLVQTEFIPEEEIEMAIRSPLGIISSDGAGLFSLDGHERETGHPRSTGTFSRFLRKYVRENQVVDLIEGLRRITLLPAERMALAVPGMGERGRIRKGAFADITVFDPNEIGERATYAEPYQYSAGIRYVLVNGEVVLNGGEVNVSSSPGRWLRHPASE